MALIVPLSVLDLAPIPLGSTASDALRNSLDLARHVERLGYTRHWVAEHHNSPVIAEQFGTLEALYPGRIDLGLGRAPGSTEPKPAKPVAKKGSS